MKVDATAASPAVPALIEVLNNRRLYFWHSEAAEALGKIGPPALAAVPALLSALKDDSVAVRHFAAEALSRIRPSSAALALEQINK